MGKHNIKIAYIGGGSKFWARTFMYDLALSDDLSGEIALYDIDIISALRNKKIGEIINKDNKTKSIFNYQVYEDVKEALKNADFVIMSILPGTFEEMRSDVHQPEKYGIYQSVGDTAGPGGVLRAMRTVPIYEEYAKIIKDICPTVWVINFTNPMSICTKTLFDVFPNIKAFGCCHEVFNTKEFLCRVLWEEMKIDVTIDDLDVEVSGINHFTWMSEAKYKDIDIFSLLPNFIQNNYEIGYYERKGKRFDFRTNPFSYGNKVKMDLFNRYHILGSAGDRHLVEFMNNNWYLKDKQTINNWLFNLTTVDYRINQANERIASTIALANETKKLDLIKSNEKAVEILKALIGMGDIKTNANYTNIGQMEDFPRNSIVETNCKFSNNKIEPIVAKSLPKEVKNMVLRCSNNIDGLYEAIKERDLKKIFANFLNEPLCSNLDLNNAKQLFKEMCYNTSKYLSKYYDLDDFFKKEEIC